MSGFFSSIYTRAATTANTSWSTITKAAATVGLVRDDQSRATSDGGKWKEVIVRLELHIGSQKAVGTGFFLNIPGSTQDVIVTAGHNLIRPAADPRGRPQQISKINIKITDENGELVTETVTPNAYRICTAYMNAPGPMADSADDYGVILLDRPIVGGIPTPRSAFGYNIVLAAMDLSTAEPGTVLAGQVGGYPQNMQPNDLSQRPKFRFAAAVFGRYAERQLTYHAGTDHGMSGGPVWVNYLGEDIAVGIHNKYEEKAGDGNRGARLGLETMRNIFLWAGADTGLLGKAISVYQGKTPSPLKHPLLIQCDRRIEKKDGVEPLCYAWSGPDRDPELTSFDIIPAQSSPTYAATSNAFYIFCHNAPNGFVRFIRFDTNPDVTPKQVTYTLKPDGACLVKLEQGKRQRSGLVSFKPSDPFKIAAVQNHDVDALPKGKLYPEFKLTFWTEDIPPPNDPFGLERARLGLIMRLQRYRAKAPQEYDDFLLA